MDDFFCHADLFVANATHFYFCEVGRFLEAADYPKQSDRALHRCVEARPVEASRSHTGRYIHCK